MNFLKCFFFNNENYFWYKVRAARAGRASLPNATPYCIRNVSKDVLTLTHLQRGERLLLQQYTQKQRSKCVLTS